MQTASPSLDVNHSITSPQEIEGAKLAERLIKYIGARNGRFLLDDKGDLFVCFDEREVLLSQENLHLSDLFLDACNVTTVLVSAKIAIQRLLVHAQKAASRVSSHNFSAVSNDARTIYLPVAGENLLKISEQAIERAPNGTNADEFWVKHPKGKPFKYVEADPREGLNDFERLLVNSLSCKHPEMRWFVAMHEGLFPIIRNLCQARLLVIHQGPSQHGKTSGAQRFTLLHGLGDVQGDVTVAALTNGGDMGLLVLDNKEQANFKQSFIDYCLFLSTGAERGRSNSEGTATRSSNKSRPVGVITTIEGVFKDELRERCVPVEFYLHGEKRDREEIEAEITERRDVINSSLVPVLQRFLVIRKQKPSPNTIPGFGNHFAALCDLLRAFGEIAGKPQEWGEDLIVAWDRIVRRNTDDEEENELEFPISQILREANSVITINVQFNEMDFRGRRGTLFVTQSGYLLDRLLQRPAINQLLPKTPSALSRRIYSSRFRGFTVVKEGELPELKRSAGLRPIGFFFPNDGNDS